MPKNQLYELKERLSAAIFGAEKASDLLLTALLARGHALIEGAPGVGKTSLAQTLANGIGGTFKRIQFTPDLLPSDILGYHLYRQHNGDFDFIHVVDTPGEAYTIIKEHQHECLREWGLDIPQETPSKEKG